MATNYFPTDDETYRMLSFVGDEFDATVSTVYVRYYGLSWKTFVFMLNISLELAA